RRTATAISMPYRAPRRPRIGHLKDGTCVADDPNCGTYFSLPDCQNFGEHDRGRKAMGSLPSRGGTDKAARLPKGWTGPVGMLGHPDLWIGVRVFFFSAGALAPFSAFPFRIVTAMTLPPSLTHQRTCRSRASGLP